MWTAWNLCNPFLTLQGLLHHLELPVAACIEQIANPYHIVMYSCGKLKSTFCMWLVTTELIWLRYFFFVTPTCVNSSVILHVVGHVTDIPLCLWNDMEPVWYGLQFLCTLCNSNYVSNKPEIWCLLLCITQGSVVVKHLWLHAIALLCVSISCVFWHVRNLIH